MATKIDLAKEDKIYYTAKTKPQIVEFPKIPYLAIEGKGEPAGKAFTEAVQALYPFAYGIKGICKKSGKDFTVVKLEGLWWVKSNKPALEVPRQEWYWKLLIRLPDFVTSEIAEKARLEVIKKKKVDLLKDIKFEKMTEGKCIQVLYVGPYTTEPETIAEMRKMMELNNFIENGLHHEIYLSDPRKTPPQKMKTILRQPVKSKK
ncbi:GyrI-like domain-containing protein [Candidatus Kaiserbacteria bacterium]|nr:GyrI-like domain-containing protein [Candidatus Kaiserbacteria bacterium]